VPMRGKRRIVGSHGMAQLPPPSLLLERGSHRQRRGRERRAASRPADDQRPDPATGRAARGELLRRSGRRVSPTEMGQAVFRYADEIFSLGRELVDMIRGRPSGRPMHVVVGVVDVVPKSIAHWLIEPALHLGEKVRPLCREADPEQLLAQLSMQNLDVVLADAPIGPSVKVRAYNHLLGETGVSFLARARLANRYRRR
jgi:DNA-binding transcriptional LysR family regulator